MRAADTTKSCWLASVAAAVAMLLFTTDCGRKNAPVDTDRGRAGPKTLPDRPETGLRHKAPQPPAQRPGYWKLAADLVALAAAGKGTTTCRTPLGSLGALKSHAVWPCVYLAPPGAESTGARASSDPFATAGCVTAGTHTPSVAAFARPGATLRPSSRMLGYLKKNYEIGVYDYRKAIHLKADCRYAFDLELEDRPTRLTFAFVALWGHNHTVPARLEVRLTEDEQREKTVWHTTLQRQSRLWRPVQVQLSGKTGGGNVRRRKVKLEFRATGDPDRSVQVAVANPTVTVETHAPRPDNVLFILVDTMRADVVGAVGGRHGATPNIDRLARKGVVFTRGYTAATWTRPSIMALLTSLFPHRYEPITRRFTPPVPLKWAFYRKRPQLLPILMARRGYATFCVGNNFFLGHTPRSGLDHGFRVTQDIRHHILDSPAITRRAIQIMEEMKSTPFFLFLHYDSPHYPHSFPPEFMKQIRPDGRWARDPAMRSYLATVAYADAQVGLLTSALHRFGLEQRTLVILFSDHGELIFRWHGGRDEIRRRFSHGWILYDEVARVPIVIVRPGKIPAGRVIRRVVRTVDIPATVADHTGLRWPGPVDGRSLARYWTPSVASSEKPRPGLTMSRAGYMLQNERYKYILFRAPIPTRSERPAGESIFDLNKDPEERRNLAGSDPARLLKMRQELKALLESKPKDR